MIYNLEKNNRGDDNGLLKRMARIVQRASFRLRNNRHDNGDIFNRDSDERPLNLQDNDESDGRNRTYATRSNPLGFSRSTANGGRYDHALGNGSRTNDEVGRVSRRADGIFR